MEFDLLSVDQLIAAQTDAQAFACERGCASCCHQLIVLTRYADGQAILDAAENSMSGEQFARFADEVRHQAERINATTHEEAEAKKWTCPLLIDGECSVYEVRPIACRSVFSPDPSCCKAMMEAERFDELTSEHQALATEIADRAIALQIDVNDRRPIDGPVELRSLLVDLLDARADE